MARLEHPLAEPEDPDGLVGEPNAALDRVREADQAGRLVEEADVDDLGVEDLLDPVAHEVVHRLHIEALGQSALDVVDQRELGAALAGLVDQPGPLERRRDVGGHEDQEVPVGLGVADLLAVALHDDGADRAALGPQRHPEPVLGDHTEEGPVSALDAGLQVFGRKQQGPPLSNEVGSDPGGLPRPHRLPHVRVGDVLVHLVAVERPVHPLAFLVVQHDVEVLRVHELADDAVDLGVELLHVLRGARDLRDAVEGVLDLLCARDVGHERASFRGSAVHSISRDCFPRISMRTSPLGPCTTL